MCVFALTELFLDTPKKETPPPQLLTFLLKCWLTIQRDDNQSYASPSCCLLKQSSKSQQYVAVQDWHMLIHTKGITHVMHREHTRLHVAYPFTVEKQLLAKDVEE